MKLAEDIYGMYLFGRLFKFSAKCLFVTMVGAFPILSIPLMTGLYNKLDETPKRGPKETMEAHPVFKKTGLFSCLSFGCFLVMCFLVGLLQGAGFHTSEDLQVIPGHALFEGLLSLITVVWLASVVIIIAQYLWLKSQTRNKAVSYQNHDLPLR